MTGFRLEKLWNQSVRRTRRRAGRSLNTTPAVTETLEDRLLLTIDIVFDYTYDTDGFFAPQSRRDILESAASVYESRITDDLTAITPGGSNTWNAVFANPTTGVQVSLPNLTVPADTIIVYIGAQNLTSGLGLGGPGGFNAVASQQFLTNLQTRGETGVDPDGTTDTDFSLWGGTIAFDNAVTWNFTLNEPVSGENDLYSVALHELGHVLGFGTSDSFRNLVDGSGNFTGAVATAAFGGPIPMSTDQFGNVDAGHYAANTMGVIPGTTTQQESAFDPELTTGTRKVITDIGWGAIDDLGWDVSAVAGPTDYGDAPDASSGTGPGNYQTRSADQGPSHGIVTGLHIGTAPDADDGTLQNSTATSDDNLDGSDEGFTLSETLFIAEGQSARIDVNVTNTVADAVLYGWIDFDGDGVFETSERTVAQVTNGTNNGTVTLVFPASANGTAGETFARFRLSSDASASIPTGAAANGEVEDHSVTILPATVAFDSLPLFNWPAVTGASRYELEVTNLSTSQVQILQSEVATNSFRPHEALPVGVYSWRYRAFVGSSFQPFQAPQAFSILETGGTPFITDPTNASVDSRPTIAWSPVENATRYELWVNGANKERAIHQTTLTTTSFTPLTGLAADSYTAWVRAFNGGTALNSWSPAFSFTLPTSGASVLTDPVGSSTNSAPIFSWLPMNSLRYTLQVDSVTTGQASVIFEPNLTGTSYTPDVGLPAGSYVATITGLGSTQSAQVSFQVEEVTGQAEFAIASGRSENPLPSFSWTNVAGATRYELWVDDIPNGLSQVIHSSSLTDTVFKATKPLPPSTYRAWVRAFNGSTQIGTWSTPIDYVVRESAAVPTIWSPINETQNAAPTFAWSNVTGATHYEFDIADSTAVVVQTQQNITSNSLTLMDALPVGTYLTTVRSYNGTNLLGTDSRRAYITSNTSGTEMFGPLGTTTATRPTFSWAGVDTATRYFLWVNDDTRGVNRAILQSNLQTTSFTAQDALLPGDYRAWVRAYNGATPVGPWTFANRFTVAEVAGVPSITAPVPNTANPIPAVTWTSVTGAASYDIEIDNLKTSQNSFITATGITTTVFRPSQALETSQYRIRVRSVDGAGTPSAWSSGFDLTIVSTTTSTLVSPLAGTSSASADVLFAWTSVTTAARYDLWVNNLSTGVTQQIRDTNIQAISFTPATNLAAGNYRAWVRAIAADGTPGAWSSSVDFTVVDASFESEFLNTQPLLAVALLPEIQDDMPTVTAAKEAEAPVERPSEVSTTVASESRQAAKTEDRLPESIVDAILIEFAEGRQLAITR